jgi:hypothetical protein
MRIKEARMLEKDSRSAACAALAVARHTAP